MPFITIQMLEGRTQDQKDKLAEEVTEVVSRNTGAPVENIHVIIEDMKKGNYAVGGKMKR